MLKSYIIQGQPHKKDEVKQNMKHYWPIRHEVAMINGIARNCNKIIVPFLLPREILKQLHSNHMGIEKMRLLARELVYWVNIKKWCATGLEYLETQPQREDNCIGGIMQAVGGSWH